MAPQHCLRRLKSPPEDHRGSFQRSLRVEFLGFMKSVTAAFPGRKLKNEHWLKAHPNGAISFHASSAARCLAFIKTATRKRSEMEHRDELSESRHPVLPATRAKWELAMDICAPVWHAL